MQSKAIISTIIAVFCLIMPIFAEAEESSDQELIYSQELTLTASAIKARLEFKKIITETGLQPETIWNIATGKIFQIQDDIRRQAMLRNNLTTVGSRDRKPEDFIFTPKKPKKVEQKPRTWKKFAKPVGIFIITYTLWQLLFASDVESAELNYKLHNDLCINFSLDLEATYCISTSLDQFNAILIGSDSSAEEKFAVDFLLAGDFVALINYYHYNSQHFDL